MKLFYFDIPGRGEAIRLLFHHANIPYQDIRIRMHDWPNIRFMKEFEFHCLPVLELPDGLKISQSHAILEYLGIQYGYFSLEEEFVYNIKSVMEFLEDFFNVFGEIMMKSSKNQTEDPIFIEKKEKFISEDIPTTLTILEGKLKENTLSKEFFIGNKLSILDFYILGLFTNFQVPQIKSVFDDALKNFKRFGEYLEKRKFEFENYYESKAPVSYRLRYLEFKGRAECIRLLFKHAKIEFFDDRLRIDQWLVEKKTGKYEFGHLPALEEKGQIYVETIAILMKLGVRWYYYSTNPEIQSEILYIIAICKHVLEDLLKLYHKSSTTEENKKKIRKNLVENSIHFLLSSLDIALKNNRSQEYFVGKNITIADFYVLGSIYSNFLENYAQLSAEFVSQLEKFPTLKAYFQLLMSEFK